MFEQEKHTEKIDFLIDNLVSTIELTQSGESLFVKHGQCDGYWYDEKIGNASEHELEILSKYHGGIYEDMLLRNKLRLSPETATELTRNLVESQIIPPNTSVSKFRLGFLYMDRGNGDSTSTISVEDAEVVFNKGVYKELDKAKISLLNYPFHLRISKNKDKLSSSSSISLPRIDDRIKSLINFKLEKPFFDELLDVHQQIQSIKDMQWKKKNINEQDIRLAEYILEVLISRRINL